MFIFKPHFHRGAELLLPLRTNNPFLGCGTTPSNDNYKSIPLLPLPKKETAAKLVRDELFL